MSVYHHLEGWTFFGLLGLLFNISCCKIKNVFKFVFLHFLSKKIVFHTHWHIWAHTYLFGNTHKHTQIGNKIGNLPYLFTTNFINPWVGIGETKQTHTHTHTYWRHTHTYLQMHRNVHLLLLEVKLETNLEIKLETYFNYSLLLLETQNLLKLV